MKSTNIAVSIEQKDFYGHLGRFLKVPRGFLELSQVLFWKMPRGIKKASILAGHFQPGHKHAVFLGFTFSASAGSQASQNRGGASRSKSDPASAENRVLVVKYNFKYLRNTSIALCENLKNNHSSNWKAVWCFFGCYEYCNVHKPIFKLFSRNLKCS